MSLIRSVPVFIFLLSVVSTQIHGFVPLRCNQRVLHTSVFLRQSPTRTTTAAATKSTTRTATTSTARFLLYDDKELQQIYASDNDCNSSLLESLQARQDALSLGIGKRYITRTQKGFLNVHYEPTDPYDTANIVGQLEEGQIVTSTGPSRGFWIPHDAGGWSVWKHGGFTWLEAIEE